MRLLEHLTELITLAEELNYENVALRAVLEHTNPPGWKEHYRQEMLNWDKRHEAGNPFRAYAEHIEQQPDYEILLTLLSARVGELRKELNKNRA
jgi:hypothetical protein